jgi:hypothetical protein
LAFEDAEAAEYRSPASWRVDSWRVKVQRSLGLTPPIVKVLPGFLPPAALAAVPFLASFFFFSFPESA